MKVKLLTSRAGPGFSQTAGQVIDVSNATATRLIESRQAVPHREESVEAATSPQAAQAETTVNRRPGRPRKNS